MYTETFAEGNTILHRADPRGKIIGAVLIILPIVTSESMVTPCIGLLTALLLTWIGRLPPAMLGKRLKAVNLFMLFLWLTLPFTTPGEKITSLGLFRPSREGLLLALQITIKGNATMLIIFSLITTSSIHNIGYGLNKLGISKKLILMLLTTLRYLALIEQEFHRLQRAADLRCFQAKTNIHTYRTYSYMIGMTVIRSWERSRRIRNAMRLRNFQGEFPLLEQTKFTTLDGLLLLFLSALSLCPLLGPFIF